MASRWIATIFALFATGPTLSQGTGLPAPYAPVISDAYGFVAVPNAAVMPDKGHTYRAIFDAREPGAKATDILPAIMMAGAELNTLAASGIPRRNAQFVVIFHTRDADAGILDNAHYRAKYGVDNPNLKALSQLRKAGVKLYVCAQQLLGDNVPFYAVSPDVSIAEDGLVVLMTYQNAGYAVGWTLALAPEHCGDRGMRNLFDLLKSLLERSAHFQCDLGRFISGRQNGTTGQSTRTN